MQWYYIRNLSCGLCVRAAALAVRKLDPEAYIEGRPRLRELGVRSKAGEATLLRAFAETGYPATPLLSVLG